MHFINVAPFFPMDVPYMADQIRRVARDTGLTNTAMCLSLHPEGKPAPAKISLYTQAFSELRQALSKDDSLDVGILVQSTMGHGWSASRSLTGEPWQKTVTAEGIETARQCLLDSDFKAYILTFIQKLASIQPAFFLIDDDFCNKDGECFCPLHMQLFSEALRQPIDRPALVKTLKQCTSDAIEVQSVTRVLHDSLVNVAHEIRAAIDKEQPTIRCGFCCPGTGHHNLGEVTRALAGNTEPFLRIACAIYGDATPHALNAMSRDTAIRIEAAEGVKDLIAESDTFPQNLYSESAVALHAHVATSIVNGLNGSKLWNTCFHNKDPLSGKAYETIIHENQLFYDELLTTTRELEWQGVVTPLSDHRRHYHPLTPFVPFQFPDFILPLVGRFGIPYQYTALHGKRVCMLAGEHAERFTDEEITRFLENSLLLDGAAAEILVRRGFSKYLGVDIGTREDFFHTDEIHRTTERRVRFDWQPGATELLPLPGANEITTLYHETIAFSGNRSRQGAGCVLFENELGGRVATVAFHTTMPFFKIRFPVRREFLIEALDYLHHGIMPLIVETTQDVMVRHAVWKQNEDLSYMINLNASPLERPILRTSRHIEHIQRLSRDGVWENVSFQHDQQGRSILATSLSTYEPGVFRIVYGV